MFAVAWLAGVLSRAKPAVGVVAVLLVVTVGVLCLVGAARYLVGGPRRPVPVGRVLLLAGVVPAALVLAVRVLP